MSMPRSAGSASSPTLSIADLQARYDVLVNAPPETRQVHSGPTQHSNNIQCREPICMLLSEKMYAPCMSIRSQAVHLWEQ